MYATKKHVPREGSIVRAILRAAAAIPELEIRKRHGSGYGTAGDPDLYGSYKGRHFELEVKQPGESPTRLQQQRLLDWGRSGAITGVVRSVDDFKKALET